MFIKHTKIEYIRKNKKYLKDTEVADILSGRGIPGSGSRTKGIKKGVMIAFPGRHENVEIGFSLCSKLDKFNKTPPEWAEIIPAITGGRIKGDFQDGFGETLAAIRAHQWCEHVQTVTTMRKFPEKDPTTVYIPRSIEADLKKFIARCGRYYKDKSLPPWTQSYMK